MLVVAFVLLLNPDAPVVVDPIVAADGVEAAVEEERIVVQVTMADLRAGVLAIG